MTPPEVIVHPTPDLLAAAAAARLITRIVDVQAARVSASLVLTGGGMGNALLEQLRSTPAARAIDWRRIDLYWGDERYLPSGHPDRNETQARQALLDHVDVDPERVHPMPADDGTSGPDDAARRYAALLAKQSTPEDDGPVPTFDLCLLGVGPDGHVASVFPGSPAVYETDRMVVGVRGSPKPPPVRSSLTLPALCSANEVWLVAAGAEKAAAVAMALQGAGEVQLPAAGARGRRRTLWLLDRAAAGKLPPNFAPPLV